MTTSVLLDVDVLRTASRRITLGRRFSHEKFHFHTGGFWPIDLAIPLERVDASPTPWSRVSPASAIPSPGETSIPERRSSILAPGPGSTRSWRLRWWAPRAG